MASTERRPQHVRRVWIHRRQWRAPEETQSWRWQPSWRRGGKSPVPLPHRAGSGDTIIHRGCRSPASPQLLALRHQRSQTIAFRIVFSLGPRRSRRSPPPRRRFGGTVGFRSPQVQFEAEPGGCEGPRCVPHSLRGVLPSCPPLLGQPASDPSHGGGFFLPSAVETASPQLGAVGFTGRRAGRAAGEGQGHSCGEVGVGLKSCEHF